MKVCIGGTFNILHKGHKHLIDTAIETAGKQGSLFIGITIGKLLEKKPFCHSYEQRAIQVKEYLKKKQYVSQTRIEPIDNIFGPTLKEDFDAIIVSPDTISSAKKINLKRKSSGKKVLSIIQIPYILAEDNKPISSTRILHKEIDTEGNNLSK